MKSKGLAVNRVAVTVDLTGAFVVSKSVVADGNGEVTIRADNGGKNPCKPMCCVTDVTHASLFYALGDDVKTYSISW